MKLIILSFFLFFVCETGFAIEPVTSDGFIFGVAPGTYKGSGQLLSEAALVPDLDFESVRKVRDGVIHAKTTATLLGMTVATASADLKIVPSTDRQTFAIQDATTQELVGQGYCTETVCTFTATVMDGQLQLTETWRPTESGFDVENASQVFKEIPAQYSGTFRRK